MRGSRYRYSRRKACQRCSNAKLRCDWETPSVCTRCASRGLQCLPPITTPDAQTEDVDRERGLALTGRDATRPSRPLRDLAPRSTEQQHVLADPIGFAGQPAVVTPASTPSSVARVGGTDEDKFDFSDLELICPIDSEAISTRWLNSYVPMPEQIAKNYPPSMISFIRRILQSYATITIRGRGIPPFVHLLQLRNSPLSSSLTACFNLVRTCDRSFTNDIDDAVHILKWRMTSLYNNRQNQNEAASLAIFQSYLIYSLVLYFSEQHQTDKAFLRDSMLQLQELACLTTRQGIMCLAERKQVRPKWESWILCEAKRRTVYVMYLFDSLLLAEDNLPTFLGSELCGLPAPASRRLWYADERRQWEIAYNGHLADWPKGGLRIEELWPPPLGFEAAELVERRTRVDSWLEDLDEFGVMLFTVTSCTHGT